MPNTESFVTDVAQLDRLIQSMEEASDALDFGWTEVGDAALTDVLEVLGVLYGALSLETSPEVALHLDDVYDACILALGDACSGVHGALVPAIAMIRAIRSALAGESSTVRAAA